MARSRFFVHKCIVNELLNKIKTSLIQIKKYCIKGQNWPISTTLWEKLTFLSSRLTIYQPKFTLCQKNWSLHHFFLIKIDFFFSRIDHISTKTVKLTEDNYCTRILSARSTVDDDNCEAFFFVLIVYYDQPVILIKTAWDKRDFIKRLSLYLRRL